MAEPEKSDDSLQSGHHILGRMSPFHSTTPTIKPTHTFLLNAGFSTSGGTRVTHNMDPSKRHSTSNVSDAALPPRPQSANGTKEEQDIQ